MCVCTGLTWQLIPVCDTVDSYWLPGLVQPSYLYIARKCFEESDDLSAVGAACRRTTDTGNTLSFYHSSCRRNFCLLRPPVCGRWFLLYIFVISLFIYIYRFVTHVRGIHSPPALTGYALTRYVNSGLGWLDCVWVWLDWVCSDLCSGCMQHATSS
jgi:hypothetical protein